MLVRTRSGLAFTGLPNPSESCRLWPGVKRLRVGRYATLAVLLGALLIAATGCILIERPWPVHSVRILERSGEWYLSISNDGPESIWIRDFVVLDAQGNVLRTPSDSPSGWFPLEVQANETWAFRLRTSEHRPYTGAVTLQYERQTRTIQVSSAE